MSQDPNWIDERNLGGDFDPVSQEAVNWFIAMHADHVVDADRVAFRAWLRRDPQHQTAYADVERIWSGASEIPLVKTRRRDARMATTRRAFGKGILAAAIGTGGWLAYREHLFADYRTQTGERRSVTLPDNSRVELSAATALSLDFRPTLRLVTLHEGEAFFSVAQHQTAPFVVDAGAGRTMAKGTAFSVDYTSSDHTRVTVAEHAVSVRLGTAEMQLDAGHQVAYGTEKIGSKTRVDLAEELAWREGRLVFVSVPLGRVVASLNRWRRGNIVLMGRQLSSQPVTLIVDLEKSDDIVATLQEILPVRIVNVSSLMTLVFPA